MMITTGTLNFKNKFKQIYSLYNLYIIQFCFSEYKYNYKTTLHFELINGYFEN